MLCPIERAPCRGTASWWVVLSVLWRASTRKMEVGWPFLCVSEEDQGGAGGLLQYCSFIRVRYQIQYSILFRVRAHVSFRQSPVLISFY